MTTIMKKITKGIVLNGESSDLTDNLEGTLFHNSSTARIKSYIQGAVREVLTNSQSQVLTNKTIDVDNNTVSNIELDNLKSGVLNTNTSLTSASDSQVPSALAVKSYVDSSVTPDATTLVKGKVKLAGDLAGTADLPTVPSLSLKEDVANKDIDGTFAANSDTKYPSQKATKTYVDAAVSTVSTPDATSSVKGKIKLAGDLSGTADSPTVVGLSSKAPLESPVLTGTPTAPTATAGDNSTQIATTAFVTSAVAAGGGGGSGSSDYLIDQYITKTNNSTSALGLIYKRVRSATSLSSFQALMIDKSVPVTGNLTIDIKVGEFPYALSSRFSGGTGVNTMAVQSDGKILIGGNFTTYNGKTVSSHIIRLNPNGSEDTSFSAGTGFTGTLVPEVQVIKLLSDGSMVVGGRFTTYNGSTAGNFCKLSATGVLDTSFSSNGTRSFVADSSASVFDIQVRTNGKILVAGSFTTSGFPVTAKGLIQLNADGSYDSSFAAGNLGTFTDRFTRMLLMADGSVFVVGYFLSGYATIAPVATYSDKCIIKLDTSGLKDATFNSGTGATDVINAIALHQGDIIVGGAFGISSFGGISVARIAKLNSTTGAVIGSPLFVPASIGVVQELKVASDSTIFAAQTSGSNLRKLNSDGTTNSSFTAAIASVKSIEFMSGGVYAYIGGASHLRISTTTGATDVTYDTLVSIFNTLPSFNFASVVNGDILSGIIARSSIPAGGYIKVDITVVPSTYVGSFYLTLY
jgi:uncharacterized delta-60 repeat protein